MFRFGMIPTINKPTRVARQTATVIDHVFTDTIMDNTEIKIAIVKTDISDYFPIIFATKTKIDANISEQYIFKRNISTNSIDSVTGSLSGLSKFLTIETSLKMMFLFLFLFHVKNSFHS